MDIYFSTKPAGRKQSKEVKNLITYLRLDKNFIKLTLDIISEFKKTLETEENKNYFYEYIDATFRSMSYSSKQINDYCDLMYSIYEKKGEPLNDDRGDILEAITAKITTCQKCKDKESIKMTNEAQFYKDEKKISGMDIDIVFEHCQYDLLECKANITTYLSEPIKKVKKKLNFINDVKVECESNSGKVVNVYFVTANLKVEHTKMFLEKYGYQHFKIMDRDEIISLI